MAIVLKVNGRARTVDVPGDTPLLWVLRDELDLVGTKYGCGVAQCGACTVHVNGTATRSCVTPVSAAVGMDITTIEGLSRDGSHPVQRAWQEQDVAQCGYCQSGQTAGRIHAAHRASKGPTPVRRNRGEHNPQPPFLPAGRLPRRRRPPARPVRAG